MNAADPITRDLLAKALATTNRLIGTLAEESDVCIEAEEALAKARQEAECLRSTLCMLEDRIGAATPTALFA